MNFISENVTSAENFIKIYDLNVQTILYWKFISKYRRFLRTQERRISLIRVAFDRVRKVSKGTEENVIGSAKVSRKFSGFREEREIHESALLPFSPVSSDFETFDLAEQVFSLPQYPDLPIN